jgi:hypothetical protein
LPERARRLSGEKSKSAYWSAEVGRKSNALDLEPDVRREEK